MSLAAIAICVREGASQAADCYFRLQFERLAPPVSAAVVTVIHVAAAAAAAAVAATAAAAFELHADADGVCGSLRLIGADLNCYV